MLSKKLLLVCVSCLALSACSVDEIAAVNKQISDGAFALTGALRGNNSSTADNGMPLLSQKAPTKREKRENVTEIPVDVDTAAGRLKRYYKFYSITKWEVTGMAVSLMIILPLKLKKMVKGVVSI